MSIGNLGIGHTRYSTSAASEEVNCQPFVVHTAHGALAVAHNGELVNCEKLRRKVGENFLTVLFFANQADSEKCQMNGFITGLKSRSWTFHSFRQ